MSVSIEEALAQLDPKLRKRLGSGVGINYEYQATPSFGLNRALGGGLPYGRQVLIWSCVMITGLFLSYLQMR